MRTRIGDAALTFDRFIRLLYQRSQGTALEPAATSELVSAVEAFGQFEAYVHTLEDRIEALEREVTALKSLERAT